MSGSEGTAQGEGLTSDWRQSCLEREETLQEKDSESELLRVAGSPIGKGTDLTLKMHVFLKTAERSDFLNAIWNKEILPSGKQQPDTITITDY